DEDDDDNEAIIGDLVKNSDKEETKNQKKQTVFNEEKIGNENEAKINYSNKEPSTSQEYMQKLNDVANNIVQNNLNTINNNSGEIPPLYLKQQNGDQDFANRNIIENTAKIPQFEN
ncbi:MAG: hypothetical protein ACKO6C_04220, partial [Alphaproteobacteria bacterium]